MRHQKICLPKCCIATRIVRGRLSFFFNKQLRPPPDERSRRVSCRARRRLHVCSRCATDSGASRWPRHWARRAPTLCELRLYLYPTMNGYGPTFWPVFIHTLTHITHKPINHRVHRESVCIIKKKKERLLFFFPIPMVLIVPLRLLFSFDLCGQCFQNTTHHILHLTVHFGWQA